MLQLTSVDTIPLLARKAPPRSCAAARLAEYKRLVLLHWLLMLVVAVALTREMWAPALLWGHSAWFDYTRMVQFDAAMRAGDYWPTWSPDFYNGYGSPLFQFYAPLVYYMTELPVLAGCDIATAMKITILLTLLASGAAMYALAAAHVSRWAALLAAMLYMVAPYRMLDIFVRHALAEHAAFLWLPLITLGTHRFVAARGRAGGLLGAGAAAGLVLTHNVMALIALPACVVAGWLLANGGALWRSALLGATPAALGIGVATFFWWPALAARSFTKAEESLTGGYFDFREHFVGAEKLLAGSAGFAETGGLTTAEMPLPIGWVHLLALAGVLALIIMKQPTPLGVVGLIVAAGGVFMCHASSRPLWEALPLVKYVQFPWRFLGLVVFGAAIAGAAAFDAVANKRAWAAAAGVLIVLGACVSSFITPHFVAADRISSSLAHRSASEVHALSEAGALSPLSDLVTPASMRTANERATSADDFLPRGVVDKPSAAPAQAVTTTAGTIRQVDRVAMNGYRASVVLREPGTVELHQFWFPGWKATVDGSEVEVGPSGASALVACELPAGEHTVEFRYDALPQRRAGLVVSGLSVAALALVMSRLKSRPAQREGAAP
jgi:hypothetical protein